MTYQLDDDTSSAFGFWVASSPKS